MLNLDTHIVVHYLDGRLRTEERRTIEGGPRGVSAMVRWEIAKLYQLGRVGWGLEDARLKEFVAKCSVWPLDAAVALASTRLDFRSDPADEIIAATSVVHRVPLLTRDERLLASKVVPLATLLDDSQ